MGGDISPNPTKTHFPRLRGKIQEEKIYFHEKFSLSLSLSLSLYIYIYIYIYSNFVKEYIYKCEVIIVISILNGIC